MPPIFASPSQTTRVLADALPYIRTFHGKTLVIHYSGSTVTEHPIRDAFASDVALLRMVGMNPILVHGGDAQITALLDTMGATLEFRGGMRVVDESTMRIVESVLGELSEELVGLINQHGGKAVGLSGRDAHFIHARQVLVPPAIGEEEFLGSGRVGHIESIDPDLINALSAKGYIPVVIPIGVGPDGEAYDVNADMVAGSLAETLGAEKLVVLGDGPGFLNPAGRLVSSICAAGIEKLLDEGALPGFAQPKMAAALHAVRHGVRSVHIVDGSLPNALLLEVLTSEGVGTTVIPDDAPQFLEDTRRYLQRGPLRVGTG